MEKATLRDFIFSLPFRNFFDRLETLLGERRNRLYVCQRTEYLLLHLTLGSPDYKHTSFRLLTKYIANKNFTN